MKFARSHWINLAMIGALLLIAVAGHQFSPLLLPKADVTGVVVPGCDLHLHACAAILPQGGRLELSITPRPIPFLQTLRVEVTVSGVEFATRGNTYAGEAALPVCVSGSMAWVATVIVETAGQRIAVPYRFETGH
ncbi:MAG: hypothetical protein K8R10_02580 [Rhodocyclales bacterium]|nr:hypothetical protein [Rhodocyclales bacterium]